MFFTSSFIYSYFNLQLALIRFMPPKSQPRTSKASHATKKSVGDDGGAASRAASGTSATKSAASSSLVDWYLLNLVAHLVAFAVIGVIDFYSDFAADVSYQIIGITIAIIKMLSPASSLIADILNLRIATRVLRPLSLWKTLLSRAASDGFFVLRTLYYAANTAHDVNLVIVGACILFRVARIDVVRAVYRETWFIMACLRLMLSVNDPVALASCVLEVLGTNCLLFVMSTGGRTIPTRYQGVIGLLVGSQKLWYLIR